MITRSGLGDAGCVGLLIVARMISEGILLEFGSLRRDGNVNVRLSSWPVTKHFDRLGV